jgi:hypothetical protein
VQYVSVAVVVRADEDAVGAGSGWLRSPTMLGRVVEQRLSFKAREIRFRIRTHWLSGGRASDFPGLHTNWAWWNRLATLPA